MTLKGTGLVATSIVVTRESWRGLSHPSLFRAKGLVYSPTYPSGHQKWGPDTAKKIHGEEGVSAQSEYNLSVRLVKISLVFLCDSL